MHFPSTRLSVVRRTRSDDEQTRRLAFATIIEAYWKPAYKHLRLKWRLDPEQAADLTQEFFTSALETDVLGRYDAQRAPFRRYLRVCLDGFTSNTIKAENRLKRGGDIHTVPLDFRSAEGEVARYEPSVRADLDEVFYQEWIRAIFERAVADLRTSAHASGRQMMFRVFELYDLADMSGERPTYNEVARQLDISLATVTNHLAAMRRDLRQRVLDRLRDLTTSDDEFELEAKRLFGVAR